jgi:tetratricopeptide (TPR) repeat protein
MGLWLRAAASLSDERHALKLLQFSYADLNRSHRELDRARVLERDARLRAQERFGLALQAVQDTIDAPGDTSILRLTDAHGSRHGVLLRIIELYKKLQVSLEGDPTPEARAQLALSYARLGWLTAEVGSADVAVAALDKAIEIRHELSVREPENFERRLNEANAWIERGHLDRLFNRNESAMRSYQEAQALLEALTQRDPENESALTLLTWCLGNVGALESLFSGPEKALRTHLRVLEIRDDLVRRNPSKSFYRADRAWGRLDIGICLRNLNRHHEAIAELEVARREFEGVRRERPNDAGLTQRLTDCLNALADARQAARDYGPMLAVSEQACALAEELALAHRDTPRYTQLLADNLRNHSFRRLAAKLPARATLERSASHYDDLVKSYPGVNRYRLGLLDVRLRQAMLARADGDHVAAGEAARRAVDACAPLTRDPATDASLTYAANCHLHLAVTFLDSARRDEAERALQTAESLIRRLKRVEPFVNYNLACTLAMLSVGADSAADRTALNDRAMNTLLLAVANGFRDPAVIHTDPDIAPLRHRSEYQLLLLDLAFPLNPFSG